VKPFQLQDLRQQVLRALAAWQGPDARLLGETLSEEVTFSSTGTEWTDALGMAKGKLEVLARLEEERGAVGELELIDILVGPQQITVLLRDGDRPLSCLLELDRDGKFRRLVPSLEPRI